jgi:hypothetical protein
MKKVAFNQMKFMDCPLKYVGQTSRTFYTRYKGHIQEIWNNNGNLVYSNYILSTGHKYESITDTMNIIETEKEGKRPNTLKNTTYIKSV